MMGKTIDLLFAFDLSIPKMKKSIFTRRMTEKKGL